MSETVSMPPLQTILECARPQEIEIPDIGAVRLRTWKLGKAPDKLGVTVEIPDGAIRSGLARWDDSPEVLARKPEHGGVWRIDSGITHARGMTIREAVHDFAHCMVRYGEMLDEDEVESGDPLTAFGPGTPVLRD